MFSIDPLLVIHIQLNAKPFKDNYKRYRNQLFSKGTRDHNKEMICLNWARNVTYNEGGKMEPFNSYGGSAFYLKSEKINLRDDRINGNHSRGLYYTNWQSKRAHIYFLNFDEYVFLVQNTKPSQILGDPTQYNRSGPQVLNVFSYDGDKWVEVVDRLPDGFSTLISEFEAEGIDLSSLSANPNFTDVERLVELSNGLIQPASDWYSVAKLGSFFVDDLEINKRLVFLHDPDQIALEEKKRKLANFVVLKQSIISNPAQMPTGFGAAVVGFMPTGNNPDHYLINLTSSANSARNATGAYLGASTGLNAKQIGNKIASLFKETHQGKMVFIWYQSVAGEVVREPREIPRPTIKEDVSNPSNSFKKKGKL